MPRLQTPKRHLRVQLQETLAKSRNSKVPDGCQGWLPAILGCKIKRIWKKTTFVLQPPQVGWVGLLDLLGLVRFVVLYLIYDNISVSQTGTLVLFGLSIGVLKPISQVFDATMIQPTSQWEPHLDEQCCRWRYYENDFDFGDFWIQDVINIFGKTNHVTMCIKLSKRHCGRVTESVARWNNSNVWTWLWIRNSASLPRRLLL